MVAETQILNINTAFLSSPILHPDSAATSVFDEVLVSADIPSEAEPLVVAPRAPRLDEDEDLDEDDDLDEDEDDEDDFEDDDELEDEEDDDDDEEDEDEEEDDDEDDDFDDEDEDDEEDDDTLRVSTKYSN